MHYQGDASAGQRITAVMTGDFWDDKPMKLHSYPDELPGYKVIISTVAA